MRTALVLAALVVARVAAASSTAFFDYLYLEANEGGSSGGHVAIRFGDETYHFQQVSPGLLRLRRDDSDEFRHRYGALENRTIHVSRIAVTPEAYRQLRNQFSERYLREQKLFAYREALRDDHALLATLYARRHGERGQTIALRGAGYFLPASGGESDALRTLRERVERAYGVGAVERRAESLREQLQRLLPAADECPVEIPADGYPSFRRTYSERYRDLATELAALGVLARALPLRSDARRESVGAEFMLAEGERRELAAFAGRLADALVRLLGSERPDVGLTLLIGMARLEALNESVRTGRLVLLDVFPPGSVVVASPRRRHLDALQGLRAEAAQDFVRARARLAGEVREADFAAIEVAGNRLVELHEALARDVDLRVTGDPLGPSREAAWSDLVDPAIDDATLRRAIAAVDQSQERFAAELRRQFGYDLITHNCVSELFRTVERAGADVGGQVGLPWSLDFIPFVAARSVDHRWYVVERTTQPSYRRRRVDEMSRREGWRAWLRESNVVTSTVYKWNDEDSAFLFFTDDAVAPRPLFGALNVTVGFGAGIAGMATLPFDGGRLLAAAARGVVYSVPELAFVNVRKGSFDYVPRAAGPAE